MKSVRSTDSGVQGITGSAKRHINSRLQKASVHAGQLVELLKDQDTTKASPEAVLEARAYYLSLRGALEFDRRSWENCLHAYAEARFIYATLEQSIGPNQADLFRELFNTTIDPSIRYAAYQLRLARTTSLDTIVSQYVDRSSGFIQDILRNHPDALDDPAAGQRKTTSGTTENVPKIIQWRARAVNLEDAAIAQALAAVSAAESRLRAYLLSNSDAAAQSQAAAYDEVLIPSQDAVDATKTAIDELTAEGVSQGDRRMQALQITRTAVNYALVGWRVGRNRILCGKQDGALLEPEIRRKAPKPRKTVKPPKDAKIRPFHEEGIGRKLTRLREKVVLYDATLQSLDSIKELPGVAADQTFLEELEGKRAYFAALRCLAIARSHASLRDAKNALALLSRALELSSTVVSSHTEDSFDSSKKPPNLDIAHTDATALQSLLRSLVTHYRALVDLHNINIATTKSTPKPLSPLIERLDEYPQSIVDLANLVTYPPKVEAIPVKPLFLDVAFNYIEYPGRALKGIEKNEYGVAEEQGGKEEKKEGRKGWFGFGR